ncbi:MAG: TcpE family conjugal transfer membrane protein, partial [Streptosporangiaceae bacterium]
MDLPTYTNIWRIEKRLYKLYDFRLPAPLSITLIGVFTGITVPYIIFLIAVGLPFNHNLVWLYILPPGALTWLTTRPVIESKRLPELVGSQLRYLSEPRTWCRMAACSERDEISISVRVWHGSPPRERPKTPRIGKVRPGRAGRHVITAGSPSSHRAASPVAALPVLTGQVTAVQVGAPTSAPARAPAPAPAEEITSQQFVPAQVPVQLRATSGSDAKGPRSGRSAPRPGRSGPRPGRSWPNRRREPEPEPEPDLPPPVDDDPGPAVEPGPAWGLPVPDGVADPRALEVSHDFVPDPNGHDGFGIPFAVTSWPSLEPGSWPQNGLHKAPPVGDAAAAADAGPGVDPARAPETAGPESQHSPDSSAKPSPQIPAWPQAPMISAHAHAQPAPWTQESAPVADSPEPAPIADPLEPAASAPVPADPLTAAAPA